MGRGWGRYLYSQKCVEHISPPARERKNENDLEGLKQPQCDQIWLNLATLAKVYKSLANFSQSNSYLAKCCAYFGKCVT